MNIKPFGDRILVRPTKPEETTQSGILLPDQEGKVKTEGEIVAIGDSDTGYTKAFKVGDKILYKQYAGNEVSFGQGAEKENFVILYVGSGEDRSDVVAFLE